MQFTLAKTAKEDGQAKNSTVESENNLRFHQYKNKQ